MAYENDAFGWDDSVETKDGGNFTLLEPGEYAYRVARFERQRFDGSEKMSACPMAVLTLALGNASGARSDEQVRLYLNKRQMWKITQFFKSCGLIDASLPEGTMVTLPWNRVVGATGRCMVKNRKWRGSDGVERDGNEVESFVVPEPARYGEGF